MPLPPAPCLRGGDLLLPDLLSSHEPGTAGFPDGPSPSGTSAARFMERIAITPPPAGNAGSNHP